MNVPIVLILQPLVFVCTLNSTSPPTNDTEQVTGEVVPMSRVELSVNCTLAPFHTAIISPDLAFPAFDTVYLKNADVYDPVAWVNKLLDPATDDATLA